MLHIRISEKLKIDKNGSPITLKDQIEDALSALEEAIIKRLGNDSSLRNFDLGLTIEENDVREGNSTFTISSKNLIELTGPIGKITYDEFIFETWGGTILHDGGKNQIWFKPKFQFKYKDGGSNGADAFWSGIWYDIDEDKWIFGREIV